MHRLAAAAAERWPIEVSRIEPIKVRENAVFAAHLVDGGKVVIRVHRIGYHSNEALHSEMFWMTALAARGIAVPRAIRSNSGNTFELVEIPDLPGTRQVDVWEWIEGRQLGSVEQGLAAASSSIATTYRTIGELAARIHNQAAGWRPPDEFKRHAWDAQGLAGEAPFWGRFWELETLSPAHRRFFKRIKQYVLEDLMAFGTDSDRYSMIHADLVPENILATAGGLQIIDFDDAGFGWHLFEMATSLYFIRREPYYEEAKAGFLDGYRRVRELPEAHERLLPLFLAARGTTYLGWVHTRKGEPVAQELSPLLIELAAGVAEDYLAVR